ncbi:MAG: hypothetical protein P1U57_10995, partial [Oleibacter sp.]|nr:hypothetical protein [Thalassolituus sp.]
MSATDANKIQTPPLRLHESYTLNGQPLDLEYWAALTSKFQRDLLWAIHGPSMLDTAWTLNVSNSLPQLSINALLTQRVNDPYRSPRIGLCFEQLWQHALRTGAIDFAANVQIIDNGT